MLSNHKHLLIDDSLMKPKKEADTKTTKFEFPLDDFEDVKNVCTNTRSFCRV